MRDVRIIISGILLKVMIFKCTNMSYILIYIYSPLYGGGVIHNNNRIKGKQIAKRNECACLNYYKTHVLDNIQNGIINSANKLHLI